MDNFGSYLDESTSLLLNILSGMDISEEDKYAIIEMYTQSLEKSIMTFEGVQNPKEQVYFVIMTYFDDKLTEIMSKNQRTRSECETGIAYCENIKRYSAIFCGNKWELPKLKNMYPERCEQSLLKEKEGYELSDQISVSEETLQKMINDLSVESSVEDYDQIINGLQELSEDINTCKRLNIPYYLRHIHHPIKTQKEIERLREKFIKNENLKSQLKEIDNKIEELIQHQIIDHSSCDEMLDLCEEQQKLMRQISPTVLQHCPLIHANVGNLKSQYILYNNILDLDDQITKFLLRDRSIEQSKELIWHCEFQENHIRKCKDNNWPVPQLKNHNLQAIINNEDYALRLKEAALKRQVEEEMIREKVVKIALVFGAIITIIVASFLIYIHGKVRVPFDPSYVDGKDITEVCDSLQKAGFTNIKKDEDTGSYYQGGKVISVQIGNKTKYKKGNYKKPDVAIRVKYASGNRIELTSFLNNWENREYTSLRDSLNMIGFTNIKYKKKLKHDRQKENYVAALTINGSSYKSGPCYVPANSPIIIKYYTPKITLNKNSSEFIGEKYWLVGEELEKKGFTNYEFRRANDLITGWLKKEGTVKSISINGKKKFKGINEYYYDDQIVIVVHTFKNKGCEDIVLVEK